MRPDQPPQYRGLGGAIFAGAFVFGTVMSSLGALLPGLVEKVGFDKGAAGGLFLAMNFAMLVGSLLFGPVCDRFGFRLVLLISTCLVGGAFVLLARAGDYPTIATSLAGLGLGGGALNGATNALLNDISPERRTAALNWLGVFFGFGALSTPFVIGSLKETVGLTWLITTLGALGLAPVALYLAVSFPAPKHGRGFPKSEVLEVLKSPLLYLFAFLLFFQSGNEFMVGGWLSTYLLEQFRLDARGASFILAGYWAAIMAGRFISGALARKVRPEAMVLGGALLALVAVGGLLAAPSAALAAAAAVLVGLGFATIFPTTLAQAGGAFAQFSGTAFSVIFVVALAGGMTCPWLVGQVAQVYSTGAGIGLALINCAMIALLQGVIWLRHSWKAKARGAVSAPATGSDSPI